MLGRSFGGAFLTRVTSAQPKRESQANPLETIEHAPSDTVSGSAIGNAARTASESKAWVGLTWRFKEKTAWYQLMSSGFIVGP